MRILLLPVLFLIPFILLPLSYNCDTQLGAENVLVDLTPKEKNTNNSS